MKYETNEDGRHYLTIWEYGERNCEKNLTLLNFKLERSPCHLHNPRESRPIYTFPRGLELGGELVSTPAPN